MTAGQIDETNKLLKNIRAILFFQLGLMAVNFGIIIWGLGMYGW